jgi:hypothetical protein
MDKIAYAGTVSEEEEPLVGEHASTLFFMIASDEFLIFDRSVPRMMGDLAIAHIPMCVRSSASVRPPLPISYTR